MGTIANEEILSRLKNEFLDIYGAKLAGMAVFGSVARGDTDPESDIDVLVVLHGEVNPFVEIDRTLDVVADTSLENDVVLSCAFVSENDYKTRNTPFFMNVRKEAVFI